MIIINLSRNHVVRVGKKTRHARNQAYNKRNKTDAII